MNACTPHPCMRGENEIGSHSSRIQSLHSPPRLKIEHAALGFRQRAQMTLSAPFLRLSEGFVRFLGVRSSGKSLLWDPTTLDSSPM